LKPGQYGFHMHEKNTMSNTTDDKGNTVIGGGLGGHWDPDNTHKHAGPHGDGHRGDLEMLQVGKEGTVDQTVISTRIPFKAVKGKAFVIHAMPDNFTDHPVNGGSGARMYAAPF
jgi:copper/zinc superoxide dismutase (SODC)